jgi:hypothetical protein
VKTSNLTTNQKVLKNVARWRINEGGIFETNAIANPMDQSEPSVLGHAVGFMLYTIY